MLNSFARHTNRTENLFEEVGEPYDLASELSDARRKKLERLKQGRRPRVLDLFAGCGGMSLGFQAAGFQPVAAIEFDALAAETHAVNFFGHLPDRLRRQHSAARDITETSPHRFVRELGLGDAALSIDVLIGGPPCQAFARVGRAKLREIADHPEAFRNDKRANLYLSFLRYVEVFQPVAIVMENVPDIMNFGGHNIAEEICEILEKKGYFSKYTLMNSAFYRVPQMRERMFLVALTKELGRQIEFPSPITHYEIPRGYEGSRQVALKHVGNVFSSLHFVVPPKAERECAAAVTAKEALSDLPPITLHLEGKLRRGARRLTELTRYPKVTPLNEYAEIMRTWPGFESREGIFDHVIRYLPRDYAIFRRLKPGDQYPEAHRLALQMLDEEVSKRLRPSATKAERADLSRKLKPSIVPPYDVGKFPNKWRKMEADAPARTLMAHLGKDGYSHIHYDSEQARTISVREAARLQSFPDGFRFCGTMNPAFKQIGNAVPPLLAKAVAEVVRSALLGSS